MTPKRKKIIKYFLFLLAIFIDSHKISFLFYHTIFLLNFYILQQLFHISLMNSLKQKESAFRLIPFIYTPIPTVFYFTTIFTNFPGMGTTFITVLSPIQSPYLGLSCTIANNSFPDRLAATNILSFTLPFI